MRLAFAVLVCLCCVGEAAAQPDQLADIGAGLAPPRAPAAPLSAQASRWRCDFTVSDLCSQSGCQRQVLAPGTGWGTLEFGEGSPGKQPVTYSRCGSTGCEVLPGIATG